MKQDKKKLYVVGALVMVMCAIGAFTMMGGGGSSAPVATNTTGKPAKDQSAATKAYAPDANQGAINNIIGNMSGYGTGESRDPFAIPSGAAKEVVAPPPPPAPVPGSQQEPAPRQRPKPLSGDEGIKPWPATPQGSGPGPNVPRFRVKGSLIGQKSVVVVEDSAGNQRLVPVGGELEPGTRVTSIEKGQVTVNANGKKQTMPIGEGS